MTTVVNKYKVNMSDPDIVYIGRGSAFGNPFVIGGCGGRTREDVIYLYRGWLWGRIKSGVITKEMLLELDSKRLACYCSPQRCHGDILVAAIKWAKGEMT